MAEIRERIVRDLKLTPEDVSQKLPSGVQTVFANRVAWSAICLTKAGAMERIKRSVVRITERGVHGRVMMTRNPLELIRVSLNFRGGILGASAAAGASTTPANASQANCILCIKMYSGSAN